jgi:hypothetical protein
MNDCCRDIERYVEQGSHGRLIVSAAFRRASRPPGSITASSSRPKATSGFARRPPLPVFACLANRGLCRPLPHHPTAERSEGAPAARLVDEPTMRDMIDETPQYTIGGNIERVANDGLKSAATQWFARVEPTISSIGRLPVRQ